MYLCALHVLSITLAGILLLFISHGMCISQLGKLTHTFFYIL